MKKVLIVVAAGVLFSCTNDDGCHECHIAWVNSQNQEVEVEIGEKCGTELSEIESEGYTLTSAVVVGMDTLNAGYYPASLIHCEEHHDN